MKRFIFLFSVAMIVFASCEERQNIIEEINNPPELSFYSGDEIMEEINFTDSIKLKKGDNLNEYQVKLHVNDDFKNLILNYSTTQGGDFIERYLNDTTMLLSYFPKTKGNHAITITAEDNFGELKALNLSLFAFINLPPVAQLTIVEDKLGDYVFNAANSYDMDERFGGKLLKYRYEIAGEMIELTESFMKFYIDKSGMYQVKLTVIDNNDVASETVTQELIIE